MTEDGTSTPLVKGSGYTAAEIAEGDAERVEFQTWYRANYLTADEDTCSKAIVVFPFNGNGGVPWYRDTISSDSADGVAPAAADYISWNLVSVLNGSPELSVPVGKVGYQSRVSLTEEFFPANLEIQAAVGCDFMLMNLVREMAYELDLPKGVKTGRYMW